MLILTPRRLAYSVIAAAVMTIAVVGGLGAVKAVSAQTGGEGPASGEVCKGREEAQAVLKEAANLSDVSPFTVDELNALYELSGQAADLERAGDVKGAIEVDRQAYEKIVSAAKKAYESENKALAEHLRKAAGALAGCIKREEHRAKAEHEKEVKAREAEARELKRQAAAAKERKHESKPQPAPAHPGLDYSAKFVCGRVEGEEYLTSVNIRNIHGRPVGFVVKAIEANRLGEEQGVVSKGVEQVLGPDAAVQVDCRTIYRLLASPQSRPHVVCEGKFEAIKVLKDALSLAPNATTTTSTPAFPERAIKRLMGALEEAAKLEKAGELRKAYELETSIAENLERLAAEAQAQGNDALASRLTEAKNLVLHCLNILQGDIDQAANGGDVDVEQAHNRAQVLDGFVAILAPVELEVTAVYRVKTAGGTSIDVEQVQPHHAKHQRPAPKRDNDDDDDDD